MVFNHLGLSWAYINGPPLPYKNRVVYQPSFEAFAGDVCTKWTPKKAVISATALIYNSTSTYGGEKKLHVHKARLNPTHRSSNPSDLF